MYIYNLGYIFPIFFCFLVGQSIKLTISLNLISFLEVARDLDITDDVIPVLTVAEGLHARPIFYEHCLFTSFDPHT